MRMRTKAPLTVSINKELLSEAKAILKGTGLTLSGFISVTLQGLVDSNAKPMRQMYEDMATNLVKMVTAPDKSVRGKKKSPN